MKSTTVSPVTRPVRRQADRFGFTLLELLLVLSLLLALGMLVLPAMESVRNETAWSSERIQLQAALVDARSTAIDTGVMLFVLDEGNGRLCVRSRTDEGMAPPLIDITLPGLASELDDDAQAPTSESPRLLAVLLPDGQARMHHAIVLRAGSGRRAAVRIDALTGHVSVVELPLQDEAPAASDPRVPA